MRADDDRESKAGLLAAAGRDDQGRPADAQARSSMAPQVGAAIFFLLGLGFIAIVVDVAASVKEERAKEHPQIATALGPIVGHRLQSSAINEFLGIPYVDVPERFAPSAVRSVALGTSEAPFEASSFGPICLQPDVFWLANSTLTMDEDCLSLNIWAPAEGSGHAVMVWIHGGGNQNGAGSLPQYNGTKLAMHDVVVVTINYRLGPLGQLSSELIKAENPDFPSRGGANFIHDQMNALNFVRDHISAFGGDPERVTVFGESAGGIATCGIVTTPLAKGLYRRAIVESGPCVGPWGYWSKERGLAVGSAFLASINSSTSLAAARAMSAEDMLEMTASANLSTWQAVYPSVDGVIFGPAGGPNMTLAGAAANGTSLPAGEPLLLGANTRDGLLASPWNGLTGATGVGALPTTRPGLEKLLGLYLDGATTSPSEVSSVLAAYPATLNNGNHSETWVQLNGDVCVSCPIRDVANRVGEPSASTHPVFLYSYGFNPGHAGISAHAAEVGMVFGFGDGDFAFGEATSAKMRQAWTSFAKTGQPVYDNDQDNDKDDDGRSGGRSDQTQWAAFWAPPHQVNSSASTYLNISSVNFTQLSGGDEQARCDVWDTLRASGGAKMDAALWSLCVSSLANVNSTNSSRGQF